MRECDGVGDGGSLEGELDRRVGRRLEIDDDDIRAEREVRLLVAQESAGFVGVVARRDGEVRVVVREIREEDPRVEELGRRFRVFGLRVDVVPGGAREGIGEGAAVVRRLEDEIQLADGVVLDRGQPRERRFGDGWVPTRGPFSPSPADRRLGSDGAGYGASDALGAWGGPRRYMGWELMRGSKRMPMRFFESPSELTGSGL